MSVRFREARSAITLAVIVAAVACLAGCYTRPLREGPQLREFPEGFRYEANVTAPKLFPSLECLPQLGYTAFDEDDHTAGIVMSEFTRPVNEDSVRHVYKARQERWPRTAFGEITPLAIGKRTGWTWSESQHGNSDEVISEKVVLVVPLSDRTVVTEYTTDWPKFMDRAAMRAVLGTFVYVKNGKIVG